MMKFLVATGALLLPLAACGGSDGSSDESSGDVTTLAEAPTDEGGAAAESGSDATTPASETEDGGEESGGSGPSTATATIDGETYNFSTEGAALAQCKTDLFGIFSVQLPMFGGDGNINIVALRDGTDPAVVEQVNAVEVSIGDEDWIADESSGLFETSDALQPGMSQVDSVEVDGSTVRGTATFVRELSVYGGGELETMTGTFEATCGEERIS
jgi:hypothetical protein